MTEQEKQLLLIDLCARLPYSVKVNYNDLEGADYTLSIKLLSQFPEEKLKPYLRPMSSMTEEEKKELVNLYFARTNQYRKDFVIKETEYVLDSCWYIQIAYKDNSNDERTSNLYVGRCSSIEEVDWLNAHHFDYRMLIEKGLALEAPDGMYKF